MATPSAVLYGHGGYGNRGCEAIVRSTVALLRERRPDAEIFLCSERHQGDIAACLPGIRGILPHTLVPVSWNRLRYSLSRRLGAGPEALEERIQSPCIRRIERSDIALSIGGDTYCYRPPAGLFAINRALARSSDTPRVLWACSVDAERLSGEVLEDLRRYTRIYARESLTREALAAQGIDALPCCDPAFTLPMEEAPLPAGFLPGETIGLNLSPLSLAHAEDADGVLAGAIALVRHILDSGGDAVALIPHVRWDHDDDMRVLRRIKDAFADEPRVLLLEAEYTAPQVKGLISRLRCLVAARTHASIAAYSTGVPALVLGYSIKARGIAKDLLDEMPGTLLPVQALASPGQLLEGYEALISGAEEQRRLLRERLPAYTRQVRDAADGVAQLAGWRHA